MRIIQHSLTKFGLYYGVGNLFIPDNGITIVDNEIANDIRPDWIYENGLPVVVGFLDKQRVTIFVAETENDKEFEKAVVDNLDRCASVSSLFAFNKFMEMGNFKGAFGYNADIHEIKPFNARGWTKDRFFDELRKRNQIPNILMKDALDGNGARCPEKWAEYIKTGDFQNVMDIVSHNINCLLKESIILKNRDFFLNNWKIDKNGFMLEG